MKLKSFLVSFALTAMFILASFGFAGSPAEAGVTVARRPPPVNGNGARCRGNCDSHRLIGDNVAHRDPLIVDFNSVAPELFVTDVPKASSDPSAIEKLVRDAVSVWEAAFQEESFPDLQINVGWANFGIRQTTGSDFLSGNLIGGVAVDCEEEEVVSEPPPPTELPSISGDIVGMYVCGPTFELDKLPEKPCNNDSDLKEATILFNSERLQIKQSDKVEPVKLFLDTDPLNSAAFSPIKELGTPDHRLERSFEFSDPYVVDLFTVALHEVGHALGYSRINNNVSLIGSPPSAHVEESEIPDVLSTYVPYSTRKCPSSIDVKGLLAVGSTVPNAPDYALANIDPCGHMTPGIFAQFKLLILLLIIFIFICLVVFLFWWMRKQRKDDSIKVEEFTD